MKCPFKSGDRVRISKARYDTAIKNREHCTFYDGIAIKCYEEKRIMIVDKIEHDGVSIVDSGTWVPTSLELCFEPVILDESLFEV